MLRLCCLILSLLLVLPAPSLAQDRRPSHCIAIAQADPAIKFLHRASYVADVPEYSVRLHYINHAQFLLQTPGGLAAITDYTGFIGSTDLVPDVVTMNHAHSSHWTADPDPAIPHVLRGWGDGTGPADHHLDLGEMLVRNVTTDIRSRWGEGRENDGNSIFVFEVEGLCIGHLGHLHHEPTDRQFAALGRLDVVMAPVDGGMTLELAAMIRTLKRLKSSVVIPMHWFSLSSLNRFTAGMADEFDIRDEGVSEIVVGLHSLPDRPTVVVLRPSFLQDRFND